MATTEGSTAVAPPKEKKGESTRTYIILVALPSRPEGQLSDGPSNPVYEEVGAVVAGGSEQAVRKHLDRTSGAIPGDDKLGTFIAVAESSWHIHAPVVDRVERIKF